VKSNGLKISLFVAAALVWAGAVLAHDPDWVVKIRYLGMEEGLSSRFVTQIYQDTEDYMWFVTSEGLNRYDGYRMEDFNPRQMGAKVEHPYTVMEACDNRIWLVSRFTDIFSGSITRSNWRVEVLDPFSRRLVTDEVGLPVPSDSISAIAHIPGRMILIGTVQGQVFGYDGGYFQLFQDSARRQVRNLSGHEGGLLALVVGQELISIDLDGQEKRRVLLPSANTWNMTLDLDGGTWILVREYSGGRRHRIFYVPAASGQIRELALPPEIQRMELGQFDLKVRKEGGWLLGYRNFLGLYDKTGDLEVDLSEDLARIDMAGSPYNLYIDRSGAIWGAHQEGAVRLTLRRNSFRHYLHHPPVSVRGMVWVNDSVLFVANYTQQLLLNVNTGRHTLIGNRLLVDLGVAKDQQGYFWAGHHMNEFMRFSPDLSAVEAIPFSPEPSRMPRPLVDAVVPFMDSEGQLWFGLSKDLGKWDEGEGFIRLLQAEPPFSELMELAVNTFYETKEGVWAGTSGGLYRLDHSGKVTGSVGGLSEFYIFDIHQDRQGRFWLATRGSGLVCWDPRSGQVSKYDTRIGFISDVLYAVIEDGRGRFWLPTNKGLMRFHPETGSFVFFSEADGMGNTEFNFLAHIVGPDGSIYLGGLEGVTAFHPDSVRVPEVMDIPIKVASFLEWTPESGKMTDKTAHLKERGEIVLVPPIQSFYLSFALLDFQPRREDQYAYWLEGLEPGWTYLNKPEIHLSRLPPGKYILHLNGRGDNGLWSREELRIPVWVKKPFYFRALFWVALGAALSIGVFLYYRWNLWRLETQRAWLEAEVDRRTADLLQSQRLIREQNLQLGRLNQTKDQLFLILAHELKNPVLSFRSVSQKINYLLNKGQLDRLDQLGVELDRTASNAHKLLDNLLQWAKTQRGTFAMHPRVIDLEEAFDKLIDEYAGRAEEKKIRLCARVESEEAIVWADPAAMQIILRNLTDNALKFTQPGGEVCLSARETGEGMQVRVEDTGIGMQPEKLAALFQAGRKPGLGTAGERGSGLGLLLVKELMDLHRGTIAVMSEEGRGTAFSLLFPPRDLESSLQPENNPTKDE
jgi:signal transduction histidine kinase/sugar lactone lactonase YvrE